MSDCIVTKEFLGAKYFLAREPVEWVLEQERAARFDGDIARRVAAHHGGTVVLLDQRRVVDGEIIRDSGRRT